MAYKVCYHYTLWMSENFPCKSLWICQIVKLKYSTDGSGHRFIRGTVKQNRSQMKFVCRCIQLRVFSGGRVAPREIHRHRGVLHRKTHIKHYFCMVICKPSPIAIAELPHRSLAERLHYRTIFICAEYVKNITWLIYFSLFFCRECEKPRVSRERRDAPSTVAPRAALTETLALGTGRSVPYQPKEWVCGWRRPSGVGLRASLGRPGARERYS